MQRVERRGRVHDAAISLYADKGSGLFSSFVSQLPDLIATHGYWVVALIVALESMGIPLPGETALVTAAIFAGATERLNISGLVGSAICGAVLGDNVGYWL